MKSNSMYPQISCAKRHFFSSFRKMEILLMELTILTEQSDTSRILKLTDEIKVELIKMQQELKLIAEQR